MRTYIDIFSAATADAHEWLDEIRSELDWLERRAALQALRAALHVLRDHLTPAQNAHLSAQLPTLIRGIYYEGWRPAAETPPERSLQLYLEDIEDQLGPRAGLDGFEVAQAVYRVLARHVSPGEIAKIRATLPRQLAVLWDGALVS